MAPKRKRNLAEALEKYKGSGNNDFFQLENDKDTAVVRFLYGDSEEDLDWYPVHPVEIGGKKRYVLCTEEADCPLCQANNRVQLKLFLQLVDDKDGKVKTWERGQKFIPKILGLMNRYGALYTRKFEVERNGKKGDTGTTYELYNFDPDDVKWDELPEKQELVGPQGFVLELSNEDMEAVADGTFKFTPVENHKDNSHSQRRGTPESERRQPHKDEQQSSRRREKQEDPPAERTKRGTDVF